MDRFILFVFLVLASCNSNVNTFKISNEYDSKLAEKYEADEYGMKKYVMAFLYSGSNRDLPKEEAEALQTAHLKNINRMAEEGKLVLAGPFLDSGDLRGIYIFNVTTIEDLEKFRPKITHTLYQKLFEPIIPELKVSKRLYICADGILFTLPFEALIDKPIDEKAFRATRKRSKKGQVDYLAEYAALHYLVDTYTIAYLPSASVLQSLRKYKKPGFGRWQKPLIAFADPVFSEEKPTDAQSATVDKRGISKETDLTMTILTRSTGEDGHG